MKKLYIFLSLSLLLVLSIEVNAQTGSITGIVKDGSTLVPVANAQAAIPSLNLNTATNSSGRYTFKDVPVGNYTITYSVEGVKLDDQEAVVEDGKVTVLDVFQDADSFGNTTITSSNAVFSKRNLIGNVDLQLRPVVNAQELLPLIPGLFIAQHAGGGKAEQIFLRGFDIDHGTDFAIYVDGMPVNMVSHAHGQGYADLHFVIPETINELEVNKGTYTAKYGDLATAGAGEFRTLDKLAKSRVKLEYGMFNTIRGLAMVDVLQGGKLFGKGEENAYIALDYNYSDNYFLLSQDFTRLNGFGKYTGQLNSSNNVELSLSSFYSDWYASGQIPERAVEDGQIGRFGSIDPTEGGQTSRSNANLIFNSALPKGNLKNQLYYTKYDFNLYSNFTFFLEDTINGDGIQQTDDRHLAGYNSTYTLSHMLFGQKSFTEAGVGGRYDNAHILLAKSPRRVTADTTVSGQLNQLNAFGYISEHIKLGKLTINPGLRFDQYFFKFEDDMNDTASGSTTKSRVSPKLNFLYDLNKSVQLFAKSGIGFHSNDARAVVTGKLENTLPRAYGAEVGTYLRPSSKTIINTALWYLELENELVYVGDAGIVEVSGATRRIGIDFGVRQNIIGDLYADFDINYNDGRLLGEPADANRIPLAPWLTSAGGLSLKREQGLSGSLRYRYMADRPANEDNSVTAFGYTIVDLLAYYTINRFQIGVTIQNLLDEEWNEAQFDTESRLQGESGSVSELHYTPGTPFRATGSVSVFF